MNTAARKRPTIDPKVVLAASALALAALTLWVIYLIGFNVDAVHRQREADRHQCEMSHVVTGSSLVRAEVLCA